MRNPTSCPPGYPGGLYREKSPHNRNNIIFTTFLPHFGRKKNILFARLSRTSVQNPKIPKKLIGPFFDPFLPQKRAKCRGASKFFLWMDFLFLFGFQLFQSISLWDFLKKFEDWDWELYWAKNFRALKKSEICLLSIFLR